MKRETETVRVWVGRDLVQAQMMRQMLLESGIECLGNLDPGVIPTGEFGDIGLWVSKEDEQRARVLLEQLEQGMSEDRDGELSREEKERQ